MVISVEDSGLHGGMPKLGPIIIVVNILFLQLVLRAVNGQGHCPIVHDFGMRTAVVRQPEPSVVLPTEGIPVPAHALFQEHDF